MNNQRVNNVGELRIEQEKRKSTDAFCMIVGAIIGLVMFILACSMFNKGKDPINPDNYYRTFLPTNQEGKICGLDQKNKQFLHFPNPKDITKRNCVSQCPNGQYQQNTGMGIICFPLGSHANKNLLQHPQIAQIWDYYNTKSTLAWTIGISIFFGIIFMTLVQIFPRLAPIICLFGSAFFLFILGVIIAADPERFWDNRMALKVLLSLFCFFLMGVVIIMLSLYNKAIKIQGLFLQYSSTFLSQYPIVFAYIPLFILITLGFIILILWQHICFSSKRITNSSTLYHTFQCNFFMVFNILQFFWGLQFLKDSFNFCVSGCAVDWYFTNNSTFCLPFKRLIFKNWGSIVGGSFLNGFFEIPTLIIQILTCHPQTCCSKIGKFCSNSCEYATCFFELCRTDSYSYINIKGLPFCNSSRQCKKLCDNYKYFIGGYSPLKHYRLGANILSCSALFLICYFILKHKTWNFKFWAISLLVIVIYICVMFLIDIHVDCAEGLLVCFLMEYKLQGQYQYFKKCLPSIRRQMEIMQQKYDTADGNC